MEILQGLIFTLLALMAATVLTSLEIPILKHKQFGQFIREEGPKSHLSKGGTPTMGGLAIFGAIFIVTIIGRQYVSDTYVIIGATFLFGLIGFLDDFIKVAKKHNLGLRAWQKLVLQVLFGVGVGLYMFNFNSYGSQVWIPFYDEFVDFGALYVPFVAFVVVAMANSVNLTDGLDGLSSGVTVLVALLLGIAAIEFSNGPAAVYFFGVMGACMGFLIFNHFPAKIFMGDTGSMALGGGLATAAIVMKGEFLLPIAGMIYVLEALSVIIQVVSFKTRGKRVFKMAPIHHHFEELGMKEQHVVFMFWGITALFCILAYIALKF